MDKNERLTEYFLFFNFIWNISRWFHMWFTLRFLFQLEFILVFFIRLCTRNDKSIQPGNCISPWKNFRWRHRWRLLQENFVGVLHNICFNKYKMCDFLQVLNDNTVKVYFYLENMNMHFYCVCHTDFHSISMSQKKIIKIVPCELTNDDEKINEFRLRKTPSLFPLASHYFSKNRIKFFIVLHKSLCII